jgi:hypothetical protein
MNTTRLLSARDHINNYLKKEEGLAQLIKNLEILLANIDATTWQNDIRPHWGILEEIYSASVVCCTPIDHAQQKSINQALGELAQIIENKIAAYTENQEN